MTGGIAVVLGEFGRNFAAGMSGGIAYIYNKDGIFDERKFNLEMVELENLDQNDQNDILKLIKNHHKFTDSTIASEILNSWPDSIKNFIKVNAN